MPPKKLGMSDPGHRNIVIAWVVGMILIGLACWLIAYLFLRLQPTSGLPPPGQ